MKMYTIKHDPSGRPLPFIETPLGEEPIPDSSVKGVSDGFFYSTHGVEITEYELENYQAHFSIWQHFLQYSTDGVCMVIEEGVNMHTTTEDLQSYFSNIEEAWDVFFPYDKISQEGRRTVTELSASKFGFFWGSFCYFMRKSGAQKMVESDTVTQPVDEELVKRSFSGNLETIFAKTNWFEYNELKSPSYLARKQSIKNAIFTHQAWAEETKRDAVMITKYLADLAEEMGMDLFLHAGTLLGGVRHGGIMPWDDDIDLMMNATDIDAFVKEVKRRGQLEYCSWIWPKTNQTYHKFWLKTGQKAEGFPYLFPFVDIWILFEKENGRIDTCDGYHFDHATYFPAKPILFEGCRLKLPHDYKKILDVKYRDWKTRIKVFTWSHRVKASVFKPLSLAIEVDEDGRML